MIDLSSASPVAIAAICSNLAKACEKQYRMEEAQLFSRLEQYFSSLPKQDALGSMLDLAPFIEEDLEDTYGLAEKAATEAGDRGALRALTWGKKVTAIHKSILSRYAKQKDLLVENAHLYICEACGFIAIGPQAPEICPICKAPVTRFSRVA